MIAVVDYGAGNMQSVVNGFEVLGADIAIAHEPQMLADADAIVLPGVGAFGEGMKHLLDAGFVPALNREVLEKKKPFLGICLGLQFLGEASEEHGVHEGLGWIKGRVVAIPRTDASIKIPHMGWDDVKVLKKDGLFAGFPQDPICYFVHSYHFAVAQEDANAVAGICEYGVPFVAAIEKENIWATQFHPEKSQKAGLKVLENFIRKVKHAGAAV